MSEPVMLSSIVSGVNYHFPEGHHHFLRNLPVSQLGEIETQIESIIGRYFVSNIDIVWARKVHEYSAVQP
jgi:bisphosphoglycerate-independent phosphoglycerate mutase (AlkP superfamily)